MMELIVDADKLLKALLAVPDRLERYLGNAIYRALLEMARAARENVSRGPDATGQLRNSIAVTMENALSGYVAPRTDYADAVEQGTGSGGSPSIQSLIDWLSVKHITPRDPTMNQRDLAFIIQRSIAIEGTDAQPYMAQAFADQRDRAEQLLNDALDRALAS